MRNLFYYKRKVTKQKEVEKEEGKKEIVSEVITVWDCMNVDMIVRGFWKSDEVFSVMLHDGHEQSEDRDKPIVKAGKVVGKETKRERDWFFSQIDLDVEDADRLKLVCETLGRE